MNSIQIKIIKSFNEAEPYKNKWAEFVEKNGADIYQTYEWCHIWWRYYGKDRDLQLLLFIYENEMVGLIPSFTETLSLGICRLKVAKLIGSDFTIQLCNIPAKDDALTKMIELSTKYYVNDLKCDLILFGPLSGPKGRFNEIRSAGKNSHLIIQEAEMISVSVNTFFLLSKSIEEYIKNLSKKARGNYNRKMTSLQKTHEVIFDVVSNSHNIDEKYLEFINIHTSQWEASGKLGHFKDWPYAVDFHRELVNTFGPKGHVRFYRIIAAGQLISSNYSYVFGKTAYWRLPARLYDSYWDKFGIGIIALMHKTKEAILEGCTVAEAGRGHYEYKIQCGGSEYILGTIQLIKRGIGVKTRVRLFKAISYLLYILYYKIYFLHINASLPFLKRPLWSFWIRSTW